MRTRSPTTIVSRAVARLATFHTWIAHRYKSPAGASNGLYYLKGGDLKAMVQPADAAFDVLSVRQRLSNLGFGPDLPVDKWTDDDQKSALTFFQKKHKLDTTGNPDEATVNELRKVHGS